MFSDKAAFLPKEHVMRNLFAEDTHDYLRLNLDVRDPVWSGKFLESCMGVYSPDPEAYGIFAVLFDLVIEEFQGR